MAQSLDCEYLLDLDLDLVLESSLDLHLDLSIRMFLTNKPMNGLLISSRRLKTGGQIFFGTSNCKCTF